MRTVRKQFAIVTAAKAAAALIFGGGGALAQSGAGSVALGESQGGITDRAYISAPPHYLYTVETEPGSFLDCGEGMDRRHTDEAGRDLAALSCGVTLTETMVIPAAAESARIIIHY